MKKLTRLLSMVMLVALCFSLMSVCASAEGFVVFGGDAKENDSPVTVTIDASQGYEIEGDSHSAASAASESESETVSEEGKTSEESAPKTEVVLNEEQIAAASDLSAFSGNIMVSDNSGYVIKLRSVAVKLAELRQKGENALTIAAANLPEEHERDAEYSDADYTSIRTEHQALLNEYNAVLNNAKTIFGDIFSDIAESVPSWNKALPTSSRRLMMATHPAVDDEAGLSADIAGAKLTGNYEVKMATGEGDATLIIDFKNKDLDPITGSIKVTEGNVIVKNIKSASGVTSNPIFIVDGGSLTLENVNIESANSIAQVTGTGSLTVGSGSELDGTGSTTPVTMSGDGKLNIDGTVKSSSGTAVDVQKGSANIAGTVESSSAAPAVKVAAANLNVDSSASIKGKNGIVVSSNSANVVTSGTILSTGDSSPEYKNAGILLESGAQTATVSVNGGSVSGNAAPAIAIDTGSAQAAQSVGGNITADKSNLHNGVGYSNYNKPVAKIGDTYYNTLAAAAAAAKDGDTIELVEDVAITSTVTLPSGVDLDGAGHTISSSSALASMISTSGNNTISNVDLAGTSSTVGISLAGDGCTIGPDVNVASCSTAVSCGGANEEINGLTVDKSCTNGINVTAGSTKITAATVHNDSGVPVQAASGADLSIVAGVFENDTGSLAKTYTASCSTWSYDEDKCTIAPAESNYDITIDKQGIKSGDESYAWYQRGAYNTIQFSSKQKIKAVYVEQGGTWKKLITDPTDGGTTIVLKDEEGMTIHNLDAGQYPLKFEFESGYETEPFDLVVLPEEISVKSDKTGGTTYIIGKDGKMTVTMGPADTTPPVVPDKLYVASSTNPDDLIEVTEYDPANCATKEVKYKDKDGNEQTRTVMVYDIPAKYFDSLPTGTAYVVAEYDDLKDALPITIGSVKASIDPTTLKWSKLVGDAAFTVKPDIEKVMFDGKELTKDVEYTIDKNGKLVLKAGFLSKYLVNGERTTHTLLVDTKSGPVTSTITIGEDLKNDGVNYHIKGGNSQLRFEASDTIDDFTKIYIGTSPVLIPSEYIVKNSGTNFSLKAEYLNQLKYGTYTIGTYVNGQYVYTTFVITSASAASYVANTGDTFNAWIWVAILVLAAIMFVVILLPKIKAMKAAEGPDAEKPVVKDSQDKE